MLRALAFMIVNVFVAVMSSMNPYSEDPFCVGRLINEGTRGRRFELSENCDLEPLAKPYKNFPPSLYIIGAQKAGTTATVWFLRTYTDLETGRTKELRFLKFRPDYFKFSGTPEEKWKEYEALVSNAKGPTIDGSPALHIWGGLFVENMKYVTNVSLHSFPKAVFILRDPLVRLYSHYNMRIKHANDNTTRVYKERIPSFMELIRPDIWSFRECGIDMYLGDSNFNPRDLYNENLMWCFHDDKFHNLDFYLAKGMYSWQLEMLRRSANPNRIMVVCYDDFHAWNLGFFEKLTEFIGVDINTAIGKGGMLVPSHKRRLECPSEYRKNHSLTEISDLLEKKLHEFYKQWNNVLREDFGIDCGWRRELTC